MEAAVAMRLKACLGVKHHCAKKVVVIWWQSVIPVQVRHDVRQRVALQLRTLTCRWEYLNVW